MDHFITPPNHVNFKAKKVCSDAGEILDGAIAYLEKDGGGPNELHTHEHNHLFIVVKGEAKIVFSNETVIVRENNSYLVDGRRPHSVWNNIEETTIMVGLCVKRNQNT